MSIYHLTLHKAYFTQGFFNVPVDHDRFVRSKEGPVEIHLGADSFDAKVNRTANRNGTARIMGGVPLRDWFQSEFSIRETVQVEFLDDQRIRLSHPSSEPRLHNHHWSYLNHLQIGRFGEYLVKTELTRYGLDIYSSEVDDRGIDFIVRLSESKYLDIQVKTVRELNYIFFRKHVFHPRENLYAALVILRESQPPDLFLIPSMAWMKPDSLLISRDFEEAESDPEWGINLSQKNMELLERFQFRNQFNP
jgi:hypothetical protein